MKKILAALFFLILIYSCNNKENGSTLKTSETFNTKDSVIKDSVALKMIDTLKNIKLKFKGIVWARFDSSAMRKIYSDTTVADIVFFVGAITDTAKNKNNSPVIIMQVKRKNAGNLADDADVYYLSSSYCPPPNDGSCGTIQNPGINK